MQNHLDLSDFDFEKAFEDCTLNPDLFSHEAHLRLAWIFIRKYGFDETIDKLSFQLAKFVDYCGIQSKYNLTLTVASIHAVHHFMLKSKSDNFSDFINEFPRLKYNFKELIDTHYGFDIYANEQAKKTYLEPDRVPF